MITNLVVSCQIEGVFGVVQFVLLYIAFVSVQGVVNG